MEQLFGSIGEKHKHLIPHPIMARTTVCHSHGTSHRSKIGQSNPEPCIREQTLIFPWNLKQNYLLGILKIPSKATFLWEKFAKKSYGIFFFSKKKKNRRTCLFGKISFCFFFGVVKADEAESWLGNWWWSRLPVSEP